MIYDCAVIGGGPAGLNASLVLGRSRRTVALIDNAKPRNAVTHQSHGFLTRDGIKPTEFRRIAYEEVLRYPTVHHWSTTVTDVIKEETQFHITTEFGIQLQARKLILATGIGEMFPKIEGFYQFYGKSMFNCPYCDGWELQDQPLIVVSEHPGLFHFTKVVYNWSKDLVVCTNGHSNLSKEQAGILLAKGLSVIEQPIRAFTGTDGMLEEVQFTDGSRITRAGGFASPIWSQRASFAERLGCVLDEWGGLITDDLGRTTVKDVYAAGDTSRFGPSQLIIAAGQGSQAAIAVNSDLVEEEF